MIFYITYQHDDGTSSRSLDYNIKDFREKDGETIIPVFDAHPSMKHEEASKRVISYSIGVYY